MPHHKSCIKRVKTSAKANARNRAYRSMMKTSVKRIKAADNPETAMTEFHKASSIMDKMVIKGIIHRNNAANHKSKLAKYIERMSAS